MEHQGRHAGLCGQDSAAELVHVLIGFALGERRVSNHFDLAGQAVVENLVAFLDVLAGEVEQRHVDRCCAHEILMRAASCFSPVVRLLLCSIQLLSNQCQQPIRLALQFDQFAVLRSGLGRLGIVGFYRSALFDNPEDPYDDQENAADNHS